MNGEKIPVLDDIHHLKMPVNDLDDSLGWWERAFGAQRQEHLDHFTPEGKLFGYIMFVPGITPPLELRLIPGGNLDGAFGPVALAVRSREVRPLGGLVRRGRHRSLDSVAWSG